MIVNHKPIYLSYRRYMCTSHYHIKIHCTQIVMKNQIRVGPKNLRDHTACPSVYCVTMLYMCTQALACFYHHCFLTHHMDHHRTSLPSPPHWPPLLPFNRCCSPSINDKCLPLLLQTTPTNCVYCGGTWAAQWRRLWTRTPSNWNHSTFLVVQCPHLRPGPRWP